MEQLTPREREIASCIAVGHTTKMVSAQLHIAESTVNNTRAKVFTKLNVRNVGELSKWWFCQTFNIAPEDVDKAVRSASTFVCLLLFIFSVSVDGDQAVRRARYRRRRNEDEIEIII